MRRRQPEPVPGTVRMPELLRGPLRAHMAAVLDADGPIPDGVVSTLSSGTAAEQRSAWRWCAAFRRAQDERRAWLIAHGYADQRGHVDWHRLRDEQQALRAEGME